MSGKNTKKKHPALLTDPFPLEHGLFLIFELSYDPAGPGNPRWFVIPESEDQHWREQIDAPLALRLLAASNGLGIEAAAAAMGSAIKHQYTSELLHQLEMNDESLPF